jgi:3-methylcrotonyl-CoA carboxylase alpha subunit
MSAPWTRLYRLGAREVSASIEYAHGRLDIVTENAAHSYECRPAPGGGLCLVEGNRIHAGHAVRRGDRIWIHLGGRTLVLEVARRPRPGGAAATAAEIARGGEVRSPMTGTVRSVPVTTGQVVIRGQVLAMVEAMKMEHALKSPRGGTVASIHCAEGDLVDSDQLLVRLADEAIPGSAAGEDAGGAGDAAGPGDGNRR